eukprot:scaffold22628_cov121-Isochrysis_galbana.AAC.2
MCDVTTCPEHGWKQRYRVEPPAHARTSQQRVRPPQPWQLAAAGARLVRAQSGRSSAAENARAQIGGTCNLASSPNITSD